MKAIVGTAPNLPWWRLRSMSDVEIEKFNRNHMVEIEMKMGDRTNKAIDARAVKTANNSRKIGEYIKVPVNRKQRRAMEAASKKDQLK